MYRKKGLGTVFTEEDTLFFSNLRLNVDYNSYDRVLQEMM